MIRLFIFAFRLSPNLFYAQKKDVTAISTLFGAYRHLQQIIYMNLAYLHA
jgi:hypothetical protein